MWLWESELRELGFRRRGERYWQCSRRFDLPAEGHLSLFSWSEQTLPAARAGRPRYLVELTEFHVTFLIGHDHFHFYYHERGEHEWVPAGHTSSGEIRRLRHDPRVLRDRADGIASALVTAFGGVYCGRQGRGG